MEDGLSTLEDDITRRTGVAVKQRREGAQLSLRTLAARSGISASMISDIERGAKSPPATTLVRLDERATGDHPTRWENLGPAAFGGRIDFVRLHIPPATDLPPAAAHAPGTVEHMHVVAGTVRVTVGEEAAELAAGDSCSCRTDVSHQVANPDPAQEAVVYLILERG